MIEKILLGHEHLNHVKWTFFPRLCLSLFITNGMLKAYYVLNLCYMSSKGTELKYTNGLFLQFLRMKVRAIESQHHEVMEEPTSKNRNIQQ